MAAHVKIFQIFISLYCAISQIFSRFIKFSFISSQMYILFVLYINKNNGFPKQSSFLFNSFYSAYS